MLCHFTALASLQRRRSPEPARNSPPFAARSPIRFGRRRNAAPKIHDQGGFMTSAASAKAYKGLGMEGFTARWYASLTRKALSEFKALALRVASQIPAGSDVLEVAPGPGYFAIELAKRGAYRITGLDISHTFVEIAHKNAAQNEVAVDFQQGNAAGMPFANESFDFL